LAVQRLQTQAFSNSFCSDRYFPSSGIGGEVAGIVNQTNIMDSAPQHGDSVGAEYREEESMWLHGQAVDFVRNQCRDSGGISETTTVVLIAEMIEL
jgi:hypothetical protein